MHPTSKKYLIFVAVAAALFLALEMTAQQPTANAGSAPQNAGLSDPQSAQAHQQQQRRANVIVYLGLSAEQKQEWLRIQKETAQNVHAARVDDSLNEEQMQQRLREVHTEQRRQLMALLTPQQQDALKHWWEDQKQQKEKEKGVDGGSGSGAPTPSSVANDDFFAGMVQDSEPAPAKGNKQNPAKN